MFSVNDPFSQHGLFLTGRGYYGDFCVKADITLGHLQRAAHLNVLNEQDSKNNICPAPVKPSKEALANMYGYSPEMTPTQR